MIRVQSKGRIGVYPKKADVQLYSYYFIPIVISQFVSTMYKSGYNFCIVAM